jgi:hypothetical protein
VVDVTTATHGRNDGADGKTLPLHVYSLRIEKETSMSLPIASTGAAAALQTGIIHSHGHGHKKGLDSATDSGDGAGAAGSTENLFGSLLTSMEQSIGAKPAAGASQTKPAAQTAAMGQTNTKVAAPASSALGDAAKALLGTVGTALKLFA